jgi:hypothetical protein
LPDCLCASRCSLIHIPNHVLPILAETVNHAAVEHSRNFWVRLLARKLAFGIGKNALRHPKQAHF